MEACQLLLAKDKIIGSKRLYKESGGIHPELHYGPTRHLPQEQQQQHQQQQMMMMHV
jgi:hypothetical protein